MPAFKRERSAEEWSSSDESSNADVSVPVPLYVMRRPTRSVAIQTTAPVTVVPAFVFHLHVPSYVRVINHYAWDVTYSALRVLANTGTLVHRMKEEQLLNVAYMTFDSCIARCMGHLKFQFPAYTEELNLTTIMAETPMSIHGRMTCIVDVIFNKKKAIHPFAIVTEEEEAAFISLLFDDMELHIANL